MFGTPGTNISTISSGISPGIDVCILLDVFCRICVGDEEQAFQLGDTAVVNSLIGGSVRTAVSLADVCQIKWIQMGGNCMPSSERVRYAKTSLVELS